MWNLWNKSHKWVGLCTFFSTSRIPINWLPILVTSGWLSWLWWITNRLNRLIGPSVVFRESVHWHGKHECISQDFPWWSHILFTQRQSSKTFTKCYIRVRIFPCLSQISLYWCKVKYGINRLILCNVWFTMGNSAIKAVSAVSISHVNSRFHITDVVWNLGSVWTISTCAFDAWRSVAGRMLISGLSVTGPLYRLHNRCASINSSCYRLTREVKVPLPFLRW